MDGEISESEKVFFIKHVLACPVCRETFCDVNDFDTIISQIRNYQELLNDSTLSVLSGNKKEVDEAEQAKREAIQKQKYEEVQAKLQADEDLDGVSFVSTIIPDFGDDSIKVFNLPKVVKDKKYPSYYYVAFDTTRIRKKTTVITLEVPNGKIQQYLGKKRENVIYWAKELGVKFISVVETAE